MERDGGDGVKVVDTGHCSTVWNNKVRYSMIT